MTVVTDSVQAHGAPPMARRPDLPLAFHVALAFGLCLLAFHRLPGHLFIGLDGAYMLTDIAQQYAWTRPAAGFFANPLQGLGDIWFPFNAWLSPGYLLPHLVLGGVSPGAPIFQASVYAVHAAFLFLGVAVALRSMALSWVVALIAAWTTVLISLPCFGTPLIYPILELQPNLAMALAEAFLIAAAIAALGRPGSASPWPGWRDVVAFGALAILSGHFLLVSPAGIILVLPFLFFAAIGLVLGSESLREAMIKIVSMGLVAIALLAAGYARFLLGIFDFTAAKFFAADFENDRMSLYFVSVFFQGEVYGMVGPILFALGVAGLLFASFSATRRVCWMARSILVLVAIVLVFGLLTVGVNFWRGPSTIYVEATLWPVYAAFGSHLIVSIAAPYAGPLARATLSPRRLFALAAAPTAIVLASFVFVTPAVDQKAYPFPPSRPPIVETLGREIGLTLGAPIRGSVATFTLQTREAPAGWADIHTADGVRAVRTGNDFHLVGFWSNSIATLMTYSPLLSPPLFRAATKLLARPDDRQLRSVLVLRHIDAHVLAALGVRFVITDAPANAPLRLVQTEPIDETQTLRLYEVPDAIAGAATPSKVETVGSFDAALARLADPAFDPQEAAIVMAEDDAEVANLSALSPASGVSVRIARGGLSVEAASQGRSLLVLPFQFSHCLSFLPSRANTRLPLIVPINALETGILFEGDLKGELRYFTGPFRGADCRLNDSRTFARAILQ